MTAALTALRDRIADVFDLDEQQSRKVIVAVAVVVAIVLTWLAAGDRGALVVVALAVAYLIGTRASQDRYAVETRDETERVHGKADQALAASREASELVRTVVQDLTGTASTGRHADPSSLGPDLRR